MVYSPTSSLLCGSSTRPSFILHSSNDKMPYFPLGGTPAVAIAACSSFTVVSDQPSPDLPYILCLLTVHDEGAVSPALRARSSEPTCEIT